MARPRVSNDIKKICIVQIYGTPTERLKFRIAARHAMVRNAARNISEWAKWAIMSAAEAEMDDSVPVPGKDNGEEE